MDSRLRGCVAIMVLLLVSPIKQTGRGVLGTQLLEIIENPPRVPLYKRGRETAVAFRSEAKFRELRHSLFRGNDGQRLSPAQTFTCSNFHLLQCI